MIPIRNIYYMLSYAFSESRGTDYRYMNVENLDTMKDLCACILVRAVSLQLKRGLIREYMSREEDELMSPKGKIEITASITSGAIQDHRLVCSHDEFSENSVRNRIVKQTFSCCWLRCQAGVSHRNRKLIRFFADVDFIDLTPSTGSWRMTEQSVIQFRWPSAS